jgi:hypothetical protein
MVDIGDAQFRCNLRECWVGTNFRATRPSTLFLIFESKKMNMSIAELKLEIFRLVDRIEDEEMLQDVYQILLVCLGSENVVNPDLFCELEESLAISEQQIKEGKTVPHEEVMKKQQEKYSEHKF